MQNIYDEIARIQSTGTVAALATVVAVKGSTPRAEGSKMLIRQDGTILGSIGGGCIEAAVWQAATKTIKTGAAQLLDYDLTGREETPEGLICGGTMQVFVEPVLSQGSADILTELVRAKNAGEATGLATIIRSGDASLGICNKMLVSEDGNTLGSLGNEQLDALVQRACREATQNKAAELLDFEQNGAVQVFVEPVFPEPAVYIFGAGHIGFAVSKIAGITGFRIVAIDDRPAYANKERFPDAEELHVEDPADAVAHLNLNKTSYAIIACRGHLEDQRVLKEVLKTRAGYIGMIGSRKKTKTVFANLVSEGVAPEALNRIHSPIGLPIATETPEEIAVSIMAQIINLRRQGKKINHSANSQASI
jgi:xanthine dehydrogenase accessory factor